MNSLVVKCFDRSAVTYDANCMLQVMVGKYLIKELMSYHFNLNNAVDMGCGTGKITQYLLNHYNFNNFCALDVSSQALKKCSRRFALNKLNILSANFDSQIFANNSIDLIFANMSLQWSLNLTDTIALLYQQLAPQGLLAFSIPLAGTFADLAHLQKNDFYTSQQILALLHNAGFKLLHHTTDNIVKKFDDIYVALRSLKSAGVNHALHKKQNGLRGKDYFVALENKIPFKLTYVIGYFIAVKEAN